MLGLCSCLGISRVLLPEICETFVLLILGHFMHGDVVLTLLPILLSRTSQQVDEPFVSKQEALTL